LISVRLPMNNKLFGIYSKKKKRYYHLFGNV